MSVKILGVGGLFQRVGHLAGRFNDLSSLQGGTQTASVLNTAQFPVSYNQWQVDFASSPVFTSLLDQVYSSFVTSGINSIQSIKTQINSVANSLLQQQVNLDTPLSQLTTPNALQVLCNQLTGNYYVVTSGAAAGAQTQIGTPIGSPTLLVCLTRGDGLSLEYVMPEVLSFVCTQDQNSGAQVNNERYSITGQASTQQLSYNWPQGSGTSSSLTLADATQNNSGGNLLTNSDTTVVTNANIPDNWIKTTGTIGTSILASATGGYTNGYVAFVGQGGGENTTIYQQFNTTPSTTLGQGGTPASLSERQVLAYNEWIKVSNTPGAGILDVSLVSNTNSVLNNDAGNAQTLAFTLTGLSSNTWTNINGFFQVPTNLPSAGYRLQKKMGTALTAGTQLTMSHAALIAMSQLYAPAGPFVAGASSNTPPVVGDGYTVQVSTNMGAGTWQGVFSRFFSVQNSFGNFPSISLRLPTVSTGGQTVINAALIA